MPIFPDAHGEPFVDFRAKILTVSPQHQAVICGRSNLTLIKSGVVDWSDVVTSGRVRSLREVVSRSKLSVDAMVKAGVSPRLADEAYNAVNTKTHTASEARRKQLVEALLSKGYTKDQIRDAAGRAIGSRLSIGTGPSGPSIINMGGRTPKPPPVIVPPAKMAAISPKRAPKPKWTPRPASDFKEHSGDLKSADKSLKSDFDPWAKGLSEDQRKSLQGYSYGFTAPMNALKRDDRAILDGYNESFLDQIRIRNADAESALKSAVLTVGTVVYRGASEAAFGVDLAKIKPGDAITFKGFLSTSIDRDEAERFATRSDRGVLIEIRLPEWTNAAYMNAGDISSMAREREILMPESAARFRVVEVVTPYDPNQRTRVILEAVK